MRQYNNAYNSYGNSQNYTDNFGGNRPNDRPSRYQQSGSSSSYDAYSNRGSQYGQSGAHGGPIRNNFQYGARSHANRYNPIGQQADGSYSQYQHRTNLHDNYPHSSTSSHSNNANYPVQNRGYHQNYQPSNYQRNNYQGHRNDNQASGHCLFVYNVAQSTDEDLHRLFSQFGAVIESTVVPNKAFGFVSMQNFEDARKAIVELNDTVLKGEKIQVSFKKQVSRF